MQIKCVFFLTVHHSLHLSQKVLAKSYATVAQNLTILGSLLAALVGSVSSVSSTLRARSVRGVLRDTLEMLLTASAVSAPVMFWALILRGLYWLQV